MKNLFTHLCITFVVFTALTLRADYCVAPYFSIRSQCVDAAREIVGWQNHINLCRPAENYGSFSITPEYTCTFRPYQITQALFGADLVRTSTPIAESCCVSMPCDMTCPSQIVISGTQSASRGTKDWLADYFGLPANFKSVLTFAPRIQNANVDFNFYIGMNEILNGLFFRVHTPLTWTKWELNVVESIINPGTNTPIGTSAATGGRYPRGYFSDLEIPTSGQLAQSLDFFMGQAPTLNGIGTSALTGTPITFESLRFARFMDPCNCRSNGIVRVADVEMELGYNIVCHDDYHAGLAIRASAPTGNRPTSDFLFEPIAGSGGHWKVGAAFTGHYMFFNTDDRHHSFGMWLDINAQNLFAARQIRTFDLAGKANSRYMLAQRLGPIINDEEVLTVPPAGVEWLGIFTPVANLTTRPVDVAVTIEGDVVIKAAYTYGGLQCDFGYNFWARSGERITQVTKCPCYLSSDTSWALKGDAYVVGFQAADTGTDFAPEFTEPVRLAATEHNATIHGGTNGSLNPPTNPFIDSPVPGETATEVVVAYTSTTLTEIAAQSSATPIYITNGIIGFNDGCTKGLSNKVFAHVSYTWDKYDTWLPFIGVGGYAEFGNHGGCPAMTPPIATCQANTSLNTAVSQWAVWIKGGISFE